MGSDGRFGKPVNLGPAVNSAADEFAPMLSPDAATLLFSSDRAGGAGGHDLYVAAMVRDMAQPAGPLPGDLNTAAQEFDATFLGDGRTLVFARAPTSAVHRYASSSPTSVEAVMTRALHCPPLNEASGDSYGAMLDGSQPDTLTYSARRADGAGLDLYRIRFRMMRP